MKAIGIGRDVGDHRCPRLVVELGPARLEQPGVPEDRRHRRPQLVRDETQEFVLDRVRRLERVRRRADCLFGAVALGDVDQDVDGADELPVVVEQRRRVGHERHVRAIGPDRDGLPAADRTRLLEGDRHRTFVVAHRALIEEQQPERPAPFLADSRPAAPEFGRGGVEERDLAVRIGRVDGDPEGIQEAAIAFRATLRGPRRRVSGRAPGAARDDAQQVPVERRVGGGRGGHGRGRRGHGTPIL